MNKRIPEPKLKEYTVVLKYPDYITGGEDQYYTLVAGGVNPTEALYNARRFAYHEYNEENEDAIDNSTDFSCVAVFEGDHDNINPE